MAMAYLKPPALTRRVLNPLMMRTGAGGTVTLTVPGRRTGMPRKVPVIPLRVAGSRYLVSPYGETERARNLRAAGHGELSRKGHSESFRASEVPVAEREAIIGAYRKVISGAVSSYFTRLPDPGDHPVFRLT
jgi:deazaflavin-dependent oxidoreductase (nitroreductase family)